MARVRILLVSFLAILVSFLRDSGSLRLPKAISYEQLADAAIHPSTEPYQTEFPANWQPPNDFTLRNKFMAAVKILAAKLHHRFHWNQIIVNSREQEVQSNYIFNPAEIASLLGLMMYASKNDTSRNQLHELLGFRLMKMNLTEVFSSIQQYLYNEQIHSLFQPDRICALDHGIFINRSFPIKEKFKHESEILFQASTFKDLSNMDNAAREKELQNYIANKSDNWIPELDRIKNRNFDITVIGSTFISGDWGSRLVKAPVDDTQWFYCMDGYDSYKMRTNQQVVWSKYVDFGDRFGVFLPITGGVQGMYFFVPKTKELFKSLDAHMNFTFWDDMREKMIDAELGPLKLTFPLIEMSYSRDLKYDMHVLDVSSIFSKGAVIYENMTPEDNLYVDDIFHTSFITMNDEKVNFASITYLTTVKDRSFVRDRQFVTTPEAGPTTIPVASTTVSKISTKGKMMVGPKVETLEPENSSGKSLPVKQSKPSQGSNNRRVKSSPKSKSKSSRIMTESMASLSDLLTSATRQPENRTTVLFTPRERGGFLVRPKINVQPLHTPKKEHHHNPKQVKQVLINKPFFFAIVSRENAMMFTIGKIYYCPSESRDA